MASLIVLHICSHGQHVTAEWELCLECHRYYCPGHAYDHGRYHRTLDIIVGSCEGIPRSHSPIQRFLCDYCGAKWCGLCEDHLIPTPGGGACPFSEAVRA